MKCILLNDENRLDMRICGVPLMAHITRWLSWHGVGEIYASRCDLCANGAAPLCEYGNPRRENVLIIEGASLCDFNITAARRSFADSPFDGMLLCMEEYDFRRYRAVWCDEDTVTAITEAPQGPKGFTAYTGVYILSAGEADIIAEGRASSQEVLGRLIEEGRLTAKRLCGYYLRINGDEDCIRCSTDILQKNTAFSAGVCSGGIYGTRPRGQCTIIPPVYFGNNVTVGDGAMIGPNAVLDDNATVGSGSKIRRAVVSRDCAVGGGVTVTDSVIGRL